MIYSLKDFKHLNNTSLSLLQAAKTLSDGDTLCLGGGVLEIDNSFATPEFFYFPRYSNDKKYYAVNIKNKKNITIDGEGAVLLLDGNVSAFGLENCENVTLKNFTIDYKTPCLIQGKILESNDKYIEVDFDADTFEIKFDEQLKTLVFKSKDGNDSFTSDSFLLNEFDPTLKKPVPASPDYFLCVNKPHPVYTSMSVCVDTEVVGKGKLRFTFKEKSVKHDVGNCIVGTIHERRNNNIHLFKCKNVTLENIDMYSSLSFGVINLCGENLSVRNVNSVLKPNSNRLLGVVADMFHCVNTRGKIDIHDCRVENLMDDCVNIHSLLSVVKSRIDKNTLLLHFTYLAKKAVNLYSRGEKIAVLHPESFEKVCELTVKNSEYMGDYHLCVSFDENVENVPEGYILESQDAKPEVYISGCSVGNNRGRGFLVPCGRKTVVENNTFYNTGEGVAVNGSSKTYLEGSAVTDLTVRNNDFINCSYNNKNYVICINPINLTQVNTPYHRNIKIYGNTFGKNAQRMVFIRAAENVKIRDNFSNDGKVLDETNKKAFVFEDCKNADLKQ